MEPKIGAVAETLLERYGPYPDESAGPVLDQLVWFLLSTRTTVENCEAAYRALRDAFPGGWDQIAAAPEAALYAPLRPAGLFRSRARNLVATLGAIVERFGGTSLEALRSWSNRDIESFLTSLPGVGLKVARCTMLFGLGRPVFAVDAHIWRVTGRMGWHAFRGGAPSAAGADFLNRLIPDGVDVRSLHVNLIRLGREFCPAGAPRCAECPLAAFCAAGAVGCAARG
ncbi:endonuclease III [bacterium]|nr:endonuclease III [bacterium]